MMIRSRSRSKLFPYTTLFRSRKNENKKREVCDMLRKKTNGVAKGPRAGSLLSSLAAKTMDRRSFLAASGVTVGGLAALSLTSGRVQAATPSTEGGEMVLKKSVCTHCSVGCTVVAEVQNGTWVGQEPGWDSPFNLGSHCAKGASVREHAQDRKSTRL